MCRDARAHKVVRPSPRSLPSWWRGGVAALRPASCTLAWSGLAAAMVAMVACSSAPESQEQPSAPSAALTERVEPAAGATPAAPAAPAETTENAASQQPGSEGAARSCRVSAPTRLSLRRDAAAESLLEIALAEPASRLTLVREGEGLAVLLAHAGGTSTLLRLDASLAVRQARAVAMSTDALVSAGESGLLALGTLPAGPNWRVTWLGRDERQDRHLRLDLPARTTGLVRRQSAGSRALFTWTDGRHAPIAMWLDAGDGRGDEGPRLHSRGVYILGPEVDPEDARAVQLLKLELASDTFAGIVRVGAAEAADSQVWLVRPQGHVPVDALEDAAAIESLAIVGDEVALIATFEFSRPLLLRVGPDGLLSAEPQALAPDAPLPSVIPNGVPARLVQDGAQLLLRRRTPAGDPLRPDVRVVERRVPTAPADVIREGERYTLVYQDRDEGGASWPLNIVHVDCERP